MLRLTHESAPSVGGAPAEASTVADQLLDDLIEAGITTYFGVPGGAIEPLFNALARQQARGRVEVIPMRSEAGAAFAADGYYRATGRMAACTTTTGPGVANLLTATMAAHADRIPLLLITPQVARPKQGRGALQDSSIDGYDLPRILAECTRYSTEVTHPDQLAHKLARALAAAEGAPAGPVHLSVPSDILAGRVTPRPQTARSKSAPRLRSLPVDAPGVQAIADDVLRARAPVFYVGDDAGPDAHLVRRMARARGAAVVTSPAGKRWVGHLDPTYKGVLGFSGHPEARQAIERADLIVAFGATFDELSTNAWSSLPDVPIYSVDRHVEHAHRLPGLRPVIAGAREVIDAVLARLPEPAQPSFSPRATRRLRLVHGSSEGPVHPSDLMRWLSYALPEEVVVHIDAGNSFSWSTRDLDRPMPDTYRVAMGLSTMCWAIAAVIGATVARRRRALCICGDGSMLMSSLELTVAVERNLPVTYVILNDSSLGMVRHGQRLSGAEAIAYEIAPVHFDLLAQACGARGVRVERAADLDLVPPEWLGSDEGGPAVIDVRIDRNAVPPMADRVRGLAEGVPK